MGLRKVGAGGLDLAGAGALRRIVDYEIVVNAGINDNDGLAIANLNSIGVNEFVNASPMVGHVIETVGGTMTFRRLDGSTWFQLNSVAGAGNRTILRVRAFNQASFRLDWRDTFGPVAGTVPGIDPTVKAVVWQSWLRKPAAGEATSSVETFGFHCYNALSPSGTIARAGVIGDGALGYRYGSVNCPDGGAGVNGVGDIDVGFVQPAELVNPGAARWHTAIKIVPPLSPTLPGRWAAYQNFQLAKVFDQLANFPRSSPAGQQFTMLECMSYLGEVTGGLCHNRTRFTITTDTDLGPTLSF